MSMLAARLLALAAGLACLGALGHYPLGHGWPVWLLYALLPCYFLLLCWRPALWLFALPAMLPVLDLAPWTGWFFFEEIDLLLLLTVACGYWRWRPGTSRMTLAPGARLWLALVSLAALAALLRGLLSVQTPPDGLNAWNNYLSPCNAVRLGKAWCWAMLLLPLLLRDCANDGLRRLALPGMLCGLGLVALCALWERAVFPGVFNMASDYRITAPFSAMHTGGAALDGYLAMSLPFAVLWLASARARGPAIAALLLLGLALHAAMATFSRALYAALPVAAIVGLAGWQLAQGRQRRQGWQACAMRRAAAGLLLGTGAAALLALMFHAAGYRGLLAAMVLLAGAFLLAAQALPWRLAPASVLCALAAQATLAALWPNELVHGVLKAPYALFLLSSLLLAFSLWRQWLPLAMMALTMMACNTAWIGWHWAGAIALRPAALVLLMALLLLLNSRLHRPLWRKGRASLSVAAAAGLLLMLAIPVSASYYANERFATTAGDWQGRLRHWRGALAMMPGDWATTAFGMGTGTFPASYFWRNTVGDVPARLAYADEADAGNRYLRLSSPGYRAGYGELLRLLQRVSVQPDTRYALALDVRRHGPMPMLQLKLCQRQLLYAQYCVQAPLRLLPPATAAPHWQPQWQPQWQHYQMSIDSARLGDGAWLLRAPVQLELAAAGMAEPALIDVDNLSLRAPDGEELLANGDFSKANDYWFFSSDHHHLPWHIKNLWLHLYVESGVFGLLSVLGLFTLACASLLRCAAQGPHADGAAAMLAALAGFMVIGVFDSLLDVPRIALLFYMLLLCALLQPSTPPAMERTRR
ncbi:hypothetical protein [Janthinobacterium sp. PC23-8]|uniref:hypothetical protein n=1 Tax=Janthinobacterium sp. PC23-8 TaxID=2012679 RepID=UPI000B95EDCA|nr:hypothetical protein [Janthinobacterium sp. PC23-8]OYO28716.1 hypothetical protein CD932_16285 [Janthinobacterium sp. PC23-8]